MSGFQINFLAIWKLFPLLHLRLITSDPTSMAFPQKEDNSIRSRFEAIERSPVGILLHQQNQHSCPLQQNIYLTFYKERKG